MSERRKKDANWQIAGDDGKCLSMEHAQFAVAMDIRDELKAIGTTLRVILTLAQCKNVRLGFIAMKKLRSHMEAVMPRVKKRKKHRAAVVVRRRKR